MTEKKIKKNATDNFSYFLVLIFFIMELVFDK